MNNFALWFLQKEKKEDEFTAEVHFNFWNLHYKKARHPFLDVGIKLKDSQNCERINFFVPFSIKMDDIEDLGCKLNNSDLTCSVFNENFTVKKESKSKFIEVFSKDGEKSFNIYELDIKTDLKLEEKYEGTIISFPNPKSEKSIIYFRFRIKLPKKNNLIKYYRAKNIFLQSAFSKIEAIDFRFNEYRTLSPSLLEEMGKNIYKNIKKVHFLVLTEANVEILLPYTFKNVRELENNVWEKYYSNIFDKKIVAYHLTYKGENKDDTVENCVVFIKSKVHRCNFITIGIYLIFAVGLGMLTNYISSLLF